MNDGTNLPVHEVPDTVCQILCCFASGDINRPLPHTEVDWDFVLQELKANGLIGIVYYYIQNSPYARTIPASFANNINQIHRLSALRSTLMNRQIQTILEKLNSLKLDYLIVKGPILAHNFYPHPTMRIFTDLDIIVREHDWTTIYDFLLANGFQLAGILPPVLPKFSEALVVHETRYIHTDSKLHVEIHYDDFLESGLISRDVEGFWERSVRTPLENGYVQTLSLEDHLLYLCAHVHYHSYTRLNWLADIAYMIRSSKLLNWERFIAVTKREEAQVAAYYTLKFTRALLDVPIPEHVLVQLRPDWLRRRLHEYFMPEQSILSLKPTCSTDFRFHFRPFFKRSLPSILVMGRRGAKIQIMAQVAIPSTAWLRHYYGLNDDVWIPPYYFRRFIHLLTSVIKNSDTSNSN